MGLPIAFGLFLLLVVVLPLVRQRLRLGIWAVVVRESSSSVESLARRWTMLLFAAVATWSVLVPLLGPVRLGVWEIHQLVTWAGFVLLGSGLVLIVAAQAQMGASWRIGIDDEPTELVTSGLFRFARHPIYTGVLAVSVGVVGLTPSPWTLSTAVLAYILIAIQSRLEEEHLASMHGDSYARWASRVGRFWPGTGRLTALP